MKKNWELIRTILIRLEDSCTPNTAISADDLPEFSEQEVAYNIRLLDEVGIIKATIVESDDGDGLIIVAIAKRLTNDGHELLETIQNESVWKKVKGTFESKGIDMTFQSVLMVAKEIINSALSSAG